MEKELPNIAADPSMMILSDGNASAAAVRQYLAALTAASAPAPRGRAAAPAPVPAVFGPTLLQRLQSLYPVVTVSATDVADVSQRALFTHGRLLDRQTAVAAAAAAVDASADGRGTGPIIVIACDHPQLSAAESAALARGAVLPPVSAAALKRARRTAAATDDGAAAVEALQQARAALAEVIAAARAHTGGAATPVRPRLHEQVGDAEAALTEAVERVALRAVTPAAAGLGDETVAATAAKAKGKKSAAPVFIEEIILPIESVSADVDNIMDVANAFVRLHSAK
jgi:hypothetical protein